MEVKKELPNDEDDIDDDDMSFGVILITPIFLNFVRMSQNRSKRRRHL